MVKLSSTDYITRFAHRENKHKVRLGKGRFPPQNRCFVGPSSELIPRLQDKAAGAVFAELGLLLFLEHAQLLRRQAVERIHQLVQLTLQVHLSLPATHVSVTRPPTKSAGGFTSRVKSETASVLVNIRNARSSASMVTFRGPRFARGGILCAAAQDDAGLGTTQGATGTVGGGIGREVTQQVGAADDRIVICRSAGVHLHKVSWQRFNF